MRHRRRVKHFSRKSGPRKALIKGLVGSLVEHGRISTTVEKAKETRRHVERAITLGKKGTIAARRLLAAKFSSENTMKRLVDDISPRFMARNGGYTRIIKIGKRPGDSAEMAFIEFVDYDYTKKGATLVPEVEKKVNVKKVAKPVVKKEKKAESSARKA